jgi:GNAT superfamily N-acetyltransferase
LITPSTSLRAATLDDVSAIRALLAAHGEDGPVQHFDIVGPYVRHIIVNHRAQVAEIGGVIVAYGAVVGAGASWHLADLFVAPDRLGQGIGRPLLNALFEGIDRRSTYASDDPRALPIYTRAGMAPRWVGLYLDGPAAAIEAQAGIDVVGAEPGRLAELERAWTGDFRPADHAFWASQAEADPFVVSDAEGPVALGYARGRQVSDQRALDRLVIRPGADPVAPVLAAVGRSGRGGGVHVAVPGPNPVLLPLLERGFQVVERDQYMASADDLMDPARMLPNPGMR